jgi:hypothetical protein
MLSTPGRSRYLRRGRSFPTGRGADVAPDCGRVSALVPHRCPQAVHGRRDVVPGSAPGPSPARIPAGQKAVRVGKRAIRRSVDRRGRPTRHDPDVQRGATATLTAPSTAGQRSGTSPGRVGSACRHRSGPLRVDHGRSGCARSSAVAFPRLCWLESVDGSARHRPCPSSTPGGVVVRSARGDQLPGSPGIARSGAPRTPRAHPPTGGCAPPMSCSGSTS